MMVRVGISHKSNKRSHRLTVAQKKSPRAGRTFLNCEIDRDLRSKLAAMARLENQTIPELLDAILRPELARRLARLESNR
jgi:hypothetical protein